LTQAQANRLINPTVAQQNVVLRWLQAAGVTISRTFVNHVLVTTQGPVRAHEHAFHTTIGRYYLPSEARRFYAPSSAPSLPASVGRVVSGTIGLDSYTRFVSDVAMTPSLARLVHSGSHAGIRRDGAGGGGSYYPSDFQNEYHSGTLNGAGLHLAIVMWCNPPSDGTLSTWGTDVGDATPPHQAGTPTLIVHQEGTPTANDDSDQLESDLDVEYSSGLAQGAIVDYYQTLASGHTCSSGLASGDGTTLASAEDDAGMTSGSAIDRFISSSWGTCDSSMGEDAALDPTFSSDITTGHNYFFSSGDHGSACGATDPLATAPDTSPFVTAVGGTAYTTDCSTAESGTISSNHGNAEEAWCLTGSSPSQNASSGGYSVSENRPSWQMELGSYDPTQGGCTQMPAGNGCRGVPDIAGPAFAGVWFCGDNFGGCSGGLGGTSEASPVMAGIFTDIDGQYITDKSSALGFINPLLYELAAVPVSYVLDFHDITSGNNGHWTTSANWDPVTGLGSIDAQNLLVSLEALPSAAAYAHLSVHVSQGWTVMRWRSTAKVAGYNVFRGATRLNHSLIVSRTNTYTFRFHGVVRDPRIIAVRLR